MTPPPPEPPADASPPRAGRVGLSVLVAAGAAPHAGWLLYWWASGWMMLADPYERWSILAALAHGGVLGPLLFGLYPRARTATWLVAAVTTAAALGWVGYLLAIFFAGPGGR